MRYLSVCSGIEAATVAWKPLGWEATGFSEIEKFPSKVLQHHYPDIQNYGDMNDFKNWPVTDVDLLVGGTPCQSFSVAGLRKGMADPRGNLALVYLAIAKQYGVKWLVWENVPGVLSSEQGRDFGSIIGAMVKLGYGVAYRVLDAQYFGVPQRRRRVFVVGCLGDWRSAAKVLFEPESLRRNPAPSRGKGQEVAGTFTSRAKSGGWSQDVDLAASGYMRPEIPDVVGALSDGAHCGGGLNGQDAYTGRIIPTTLPTLSSDQGGNSVPAVAFTASDMSNAAAWEKPVAPTLDAQVPNDSRNIQKGIRQGMDVRRLTPMECERLQGFPDGYTDIAGGSDSGRYKALGNSMAVPVMRWIGERIQEVNNDLRQV